MAVGISTSCFYPQTTESAFLYLAQSGVQDVEIFFNARCETRGELLRKMVEIQREYGVRVSAIHPYFTFAEPNMLFGNYERRFSDGIDLYLDLCDTAHTLGCDLLILHGDREPFHISVPEYIERYAKLVDAAAAEGMRISQENVVRFRSADPALLRMLRDAVGERFYMTLDVKQAVRCSLDPLALAEEFAKHIVHVHISDHDAQGDCLLPGEGNFDFLRLYALLWQHGFQGDYILEVYRSAFQKDEDLLQSYKFITRLLSESNKSEKKIAKRQQK